MASETNANPAFPFGMLPGYDPVAHQGNVAVRVVNIQTDSGVTPNVPYGDLAVAVEVTVSAPTAQTGTPTSVAASVTGVALLAANPARKGAYVYNDSTAILYLALFAHGSVSTTTYTTQVGAQGFYELPTSPVYQGEISAVWASANGNARLTELT